MSGEQDPTEFAAALLGESKSKADDSAGKPTDDSGSSEPELELTDDEAELARRYSLAPEDVKRVRGDTWADRCADAERLSKVVEPRSIRERAQRHLEAMQESGHPNATELAAFSLTDKAAEDRRLVGLFHPETEEGEDQ